MANPKLPPPPQTGSVADLQNWCNKLYEWAGKAQIDGLSTLNGQLTIKSPNTASVPVIAEPTRAISIGLQFSFNFMDSTFNAVDGYWIYKNDVDDSETARRFKFVRQSSGGGVYTFQDVVGQGVSAFYWVTAVNSRGESAKVAAGTGTSLDPTQTMTVIRPSAMLSGTYSSGSAAYDANMNVGASGRLTAGVSR